MKKILILIGAFLVTLQITLVSAETFPDHLPGGKNYLDPENFEFSNNVVSTIEPIRVKPNQVYTLSIPERTVLGGEIDILVEGNTAYINDSMPFDLCIETNDNIACTFTTSSDESHIELSISSELMGLFYQYYEIDQFQLEEGSEATTYEPYIVPFVDGNSPAFQGSGAYIKSYQTNESIYDIIDTHIQAIDEIDGDVSSRIVIESDTYSGNESVIGEYVVELSVSDLSGNIAYFNLYVFVKDEVDPVITGQESIVLNVDDALSVLDVIEQHFIYYDEYDSSPSLEIISDNYTGNEDTLGVYNLAFQVMDSSGNSVIKNVELIVEDIVPPSLNSTSEFTFDVSTIHIIEDILSMLDVSDNYDLFVEKIVTLDEYSGNENTVGTYFIDVKLVDASQNVTSITVTIHIKDYDSPTFDGPSEIVVSYQEEFTMTWLKEQFTINDNYDVISNEDIIVITDEYTDNALNLGEYLIELEIADTSGNTTLHRVVITVIDNVSPLIYIDKHIVVVERGSSFGYGDMMKFLQLSGGFTDNDYQVTTIKDEYTGNEDTVGDYIYKVKLSDDTGDELIKEFIISVTDTNEQENTWYPIIIAVVGLTLLGGALIYRKIK